MLGQLSLFRSVVLNYAFRNGVVGDDGLRRFYAGNAIDSIQLYRSMVKNKK